MEKLNPENWLDQRKLLSHLIIGTLTLLVVLFVAIKFKTTDNYTSYLGFGLLLIIQIEIFVFIGAKIFKKLKTGVGRAELTRTVLLRLMLFLVICFFAALITVLTYSYLITWIRKGDMSVVFDNFMEYEFKTWVKSTISGLSIGAVIFIVILWQDALKREQKLREENLIFQNETLKNQVNPHFLFNSLNTLSALIPTRPEIAETYTSKLALIYRYILENSTKEKIPLENELAFIENYFYLHKIRDEGKILLDITVSDTGKYEILPVSLQILVENAVKHNMATREKPLRISVYSEPGYIIVENNLQKMSVSEKSTNTGLKNLSERIRIFTGRNLIINETSKIFQVKIPLIA